MKLASSPSRGQKVAQAGSWGVDVDSSKEISGVLAMIYLGRGSGFAFAVLGEMESTGKGGNMAKT